MPRVLWPLLRRRPMIQVTLELALGTQQVVRNLLADTGAGATNAGFELVLDEDDCLMCGAPPAHRVVLRGAYAGVFPVHLVRVQIRQIGFDHHVFAIGVAAPPAGFDGIAAFKFLNRFTYGNFGDPGSFALET